MQTRPILFWLINGSDRIGQPCHRFDVWPIYTSVASFYLRLNLKPASSTASTESSRQGVETDQNCLLRVSWDSSNMPVTKHDETCMFLPLAGWTCITTGSCDTAKRRGSSDCLRRFPNVECHFWPKGWVTAVFPAVHDVSSKVVSRSGKREDVIEFMQVARSVRNRYRVQLPDWIL